MKKRSATSRKRSFLYEKKRTHSEARDARRENAFHPRRKTVPFFYRGKKKIDRARTSTAEKYRLVLIAREKKRVSSCSTEGKKKGRNECTAQNALENLIQKKKEDAALVP